MKKHSSSTVGYRPYGQANSRFSRHCISVGIIASIACSTTLSAFYTPPITATGYETITYTDTYTIGGELAIVTSSITGNSNSVTIANTASLRMASDTIAIRIGETDSFSNSNTFINQGVLTADNADILQIINGDSNSFDNRNQVTVTGTGSALHIQVGSGNTITNSGSITSVDGPAILANVGTLGTSISNSGTISTTGANAAAIEINGSAGNITQTVGSITSASGIGIHVAQLDDDANITISGGTISGEKSIVVDSFAGYSTIQNNVELDGGILITSALQGDSGESVTITNHGSITDYYGPAIGITGDVGGASSITNYGTLTGIDGISVEGINNGHIENTSYGVIEAAENGIHVTINNTADKTILNAGTIRAEENNGILVESDNTGTITNARIGTIDAGQDAINVGGVNSGTILNLGHINDLDTESYIGDNGIQVVGDNTGIIINGISEEEEPEPVAYETGNEIVPLEGSITMPATIYATGDGILVGSTLDSDETSDNSGEIHNLGIIDSDTANGIYVTGNNSGTIVNETTGVITAKLDGIRVGGNNTGEITNDGTINAENNGIGVLGNNAVGTDTSVIINHGTIAASVDGIHINGVNESITVNSGNIGSSTTSVGDNGIQVVTGNSGLLLNGSHSSGSKNIYSINDGILVGSASEGAVAANNSGLVSNLGGTINSADASGIHVTGNNAGAMAAWIADDLTSDTYTVATVENTGTITAERSGIQVDGDNGDAEGNGNIINSGTISGGVFGIEVNGNNTGNITNAQGATISDTDWAGIAVSMTTGSANTGTITNAGTITADETGIYVGTNTTGTIINSETGVIQSEYNAILVGDETSGNSGSIINAGTITSDYDGIIVIGTNTGSITNTATGSIITRYPAIAVVDGDNNGTIENSGELVTDYLAGIYIYSNNNGTITNAETGSIDVNEGSGILVLGGNSGEIVNNGTISHDDSYIIGVGISVDHDNSGSITNTGEILSADEGIRVGNEDENEYAEEEITPKYFAVSGDDPTLEDLLNLSDNFGTISNEGFIDAETANGIHVSGNNDGVGIVPEDSELEPTGVISNSGTILAAGDAILVDGHNTGYIYNVGLLGDSQDYVGGYGIIVGGYNSGIIVNDAAPEGDKTIYATDDGIFVGGFNSGLIENIGTIYTESAGIHVVGNNDGTPADWLKENETYDAFYTAIVNVGTINSVGNGIQLDGNNGNGEGYSLVVNQGTILSSNGDGIHISGANYGVMGNTGNIGSKTDDVITYVGGNGIQIVGQNAGYIMASGSLYSTSDGIIIGSTEGETPTVSDNTGAIVCISELVSESGNGINVTGGNIASGTEDSFDGIATIYNIGTITAGLDGILIGGDNTGTIANMGEISATDGSAIHVVGNNSGDIGSSGAITASDSGILVEGNNLADGQIINASVINAGEEGVGISVSGSNAGIIQNGGEDQESTSTINAGVGILVGGENSNLIVNYGGITSDTVGIRVNSGNSGTITNVAGALITSERSAILANSNEGVIANSGTITNAGTIISSYDGINARGGNSGSIINSATASITSDYPSIAVLNGDNSGLIENLGSLSVEEIAGIYLTGSNTGTIRNGLTGVIKAKYGDGILVDQNNTAGATITNLGAIGATGATVNHGINVATANAGTITNGATDNRTASINASLAGIITGANSGNIYNYGKISSENSGIVASSNDAGGVISNNGIIYDGYAGIEISANNDGAIQNLGAIASTIVYTFEEGTDDYLTGSGILVKGNNNSTITNAVGATINTHVAAIYVNSYNNGTITNNGTIVASHDSGIYVEDDNAGTILNTGTITAAYAGIDILNNVEGAVIQNDGDIATLSECLAVYGDNAGSVINNGDIFSIESSGIWIGNDNLGNIYNTGTIYIASELTTKRAGILVEGNNLGYIYNSGIIYAVGSGIYVTGETNKAPLASDGESTVIVGTTRWNAATVYNTGSITVTGDDAIGIYSNSGDVCNSGTITATGESSKGVVLDASGLTLLNTGSIVSDDVAIETQNNSTIYMTGASAAYNTTGSSIVGDIVANGSNNEIVFGINYDTYIQSNGRNVVADSSFVFNYVDEISNLHASFVAGTTNFNGTGSSTLYASNINSGATLKVNNTTTFSSKESFAADSNVPEAYLNDVALYNAGTLGGNGTVILRDDADGLGTLVNAGTIAPGNSIGSLAIDGNLTNNGVLTIELNLTSATSIAGVDNDYLHVFSSVTGEIATLTFGTGATIDFTGTTTSQEALPGVVYNIITLSDAQLVVEGTHSKYSLVATTDSFEDYTFYVVRGSTSTSSNSELYAVAARDHAYEKFAQTSTQETVGAYLDNHKNDSAFDDLLLNLNLIAGNDNLNTALELMSGEIYPSIVIHEQQRVTDLMGNMAQVVRPFDRAAQAPVKGHNCYAFAQTYTSSSNTSDGRVADIDSKYYGMFAGAGFMLNSKWDLGGFVNLSDGRMSNNLPDRVDSTNADFGLFTRYNNKGDYYYASVAYATGEFDVKRHAAFAHSNLILSQAEAYATGSTDSGSLSAYIEKGYTFESGINLLQPFVAVQFTCADFNDVDEKNADDLNLHVDFEDSDSIKSILGARWDCHFTKIFSTSVSAAWTHEYEDETAESEMSLLGATDAYTLSSISLGSDWFTASIGFNARLSNGFTIYVAGNLSASDEQDIKSASLGAVYRW